MQTLSPPRRYSREALAAEFDVSPRKITYWIERGLLSPAHGTNPSTNYYDDTHVAEIHAQLELRNENVHLLELGQHLREEGISIVTYLKARRAEYIKRWQSASA